MSKNLTPEEIQGLECLSDMIVQLSSSGKGGAEKALRLLSVAKKHELYETIKKLINALQENEKVLEEISMENNRLENELLTRSVASVKKNI